MFSAFLIQIQKQMKALCSSSISSVNKYDYCCLQTSVVQSSPIVDGASEKKVNIVNGYTFGQFKRQIMHLNNNN